MYNFGCDWNDLAGWTQAEIYQQSEIAILQDLPEEGELEWYAVKPIKVQADKGDDLIKLGDKILTAEFHEKPAHQISERSKQLHECIKGLFSLVKHVVLVIESAHNLSGKDLCKIHALRESLTPRDDKPFEAYKVSIVLVGNVCRILVNLEDACGENNSVSLRASVFVRTQKK